MFAGCHLFPDNAAVPKFITGAPAVDPLETTPGVETLYTVCGLCAGNCPIACRIAQGNLVKIGGRPQGALPSANTAPTPGALRSTTSAICATGGAGIQVLYDPYRIAKPLKRVGPRGSLKWKAIPWDQAYAELANGGDLFGDGSVPGFKALAEGDGTVGFLAGESDYGSRAFISQFMGHFPKQQFYVHRQVVLDDRLSAAAKGAFGTDVSALVPNYAGARTVISIGDAPLDSGAPLTKIAREIADARVAERGFQWAVVDPRLSVSASKSDLWVPIIPGADMDLALGIIRSLIDRHPGVTAVPVASISSRATARSVEEHAQACGLKVETIHRLADMARQGGANTAVYPGSGVLAYPNGAEIATAILCINRMVGSTPGSGGLIAAENDFLETGLAKAAATPANRLLLPDRTTSALLLWHADPVYSDPGAVALLKRAKEIPLLVAIDTHVTETTMWCDYILPDTTYLERYDIVGIPAMDGISGFAIRQPIVGVTDPSGVYHPILPETRIMEDALIGFGEKLGFPDYGLKTEDKTPPIPNAATFYASALSAAIRELHGKSSGTTLPDVDVEAVKRQGGMWNKPPAPQAVNTPRKPLTNVWPAPQTAAAPEKSQPGEFQLITYTLPFHRSPQVGIHSWSMEILPTNTLLINPEDAAKLGVRHGDIVRVENRSFRAITDLKAQLIPGIRPGVVAMAKGFGYNQKGATALSIDDTIIRNDLTRGTGANSAILTGVNPTAWVKVKRVQR